MRYLFLFLLVFSYQLEAQDRPNILWIVSEDNSPYLGCYGDSLATTPHLDQLASEGHLYTRAYANAPVCAPARNTIITGVYASANGNQHMRSNYPLSDQVRFFPEYLQDKGYYCTNNSKKDYNTSTQDQGWDESSLKAHYTKRQANQPFFHVYNTSLSHESSLHRVMPDSLLKHRPEEMVLPPYHPDTEEVRHDWAQYYDRITMMDARVGEILRELEESGEAENTIVFYFSDHGGVLARSKRFVYETGTHVPCIIRIPEKFKHLRPSEPGQAVDELISFVDLAPTMLSLVAEPIPTYMQGQAFLGNQKAQPRDYVYMFRDRMDASYDLSRAVRSKKFRYIRNYIPYEPYGRYVAYLWKAPHVGSWQETCQAGDCNEVQKAFWSPKPVEELYDTENDPWEVHNLANDPAYADVLKEMREVNRGWLLDIKDTGFITEQMLLNIINSQNTSAYDWMRSGEVNLEWLMTQAEKASEEDDIKMFLKQLRHKDHSIRFWGGVGLRMNQDKLDKSHLEKIHKIALAQRPDLRVVLADIFQNRGKEQAAQEVILSVLKETDQSYARARALGFVWEYDLNETVIQQTVKETYESSYKDDRFRYDLKKSEDLMKKWEMAY